MAILGSIIGAGLQAGLGALNNVWAQQQQSEARAENYKYGEMAANNADARTRALYNDFYSPQALMRQYQQAGLSTSMMFGGTPGQGGTSGAQGTGAAGPSTPYMPISMLEGAQIANMAAQTENIKADTANKKLENKGIELDNTAKEIANSYNELVSKMYETEANVLTTFFYTDENGANQSFFEIAEKCNNYEEFIKQIREIGTEEQKKIFSTEVAGKILRKIYFDAHTMGNDIKLLNVNVETAEKNRDIAEENKKLAQWQTYVVEALKNAGFAEMNAEAAISFLKSNIQTNELNETQKAAWNRLISHMEDGTMKDIVIVLAMVLNQAACNWHMPSFNNYTTNNNVNM